MDWIANLDSITDDSRCSIEALDRGVSPINQTSLNCAKRITGNPEVDFFDVENHANSVFAITGVEEKEGKAMVKGNLTVRGIKKNIEFPASISVNDNGVTLKSEPFTIDRTEWDVKFKSGKFEDVAKDKLINDNIELEVEVIATK